VLVFPYKDCVLEGGQDKEEQKRNEIFYNETLAPDEITRLFDAKALGNFKLYDSKGEQKLTAKSDIDFSKQNLIIKGNNLLALHTLKNIKSIAGQVKLIYIDPPYNTGNDSFHYNDKFNHSTWLVFMKNRLEIAKTLLSSSGTIFISIDHNEVAYMLALMDEIFGRQNRRNIITVKRGSVTGAKVINPGVVNVSEFLVVYSKQITGWKPNRAYRSKERDDEKWVAKTPITLIGSKEMLDNLQPKDKLKIAENILRNIKNDIALKVQEHEGSAAFEGRPIKEYLQEDILMMVSEPEEDSKKQYGLSMTGNRNEEFRMNVAKADWYIFDENYGTSEEKYFIKYIEQSIELLKQKYTDIYLLRNEKLFQIYEFDTGIAFEPDFVLFMKEKKTKKKLSYQLFIEPKGDGFIANDQWKEDFYSKSTSGQKSKNSNCFTKMISIEF
jgi:hypothetical protein